MAVWAGMHHRRRLGRAAGVGGRLQRLHAPPTQLYGTLVHESYHVGEDDRTETKSYDYGTRVRRAICCILGYETWREMGYEEPGSIEQ